MPPRIPNGIEPIVAGYSFGGPGGAMSTAVAGGMSRYALDYDRGTQRVNVALLCIGLQFQVWSVFFHQVIKKGTIAFTMPLETGLGKLDHLVNIVPETYQVSDVNSFTTSVVFTVETESSVYALDDAGAAAFIDLFNAYGSDMQALLARLAQFANVDTLVLSY